MKIAVVQMDITAGNVQENIARADALISAHPGADVYVLPEMFSTGFDMNPMDVAEPQQGASYQWMRAKAAEMNAAITGSVATAVELFTFTNRMYFVEPDGKTTVYDKRHLFSYSGEDRHYEAGKERVIVTYRDVRFLLEVCYDLRFPVWSRCRDDYDVALYVANWPVKRRSAWDALLPARAIENQCWVAGANRVGEDQLGCVYDGGSVILNAYGQPVAVAPEGETAVIMADVDMQKLREYRTKFPSLVDSDDFVLKMGEDDGETSSPID